MAVSPTFASNLELTISVPSSGKPETKTQPPSLDINQVPFGGSEDEWVTSTVEEEEETNNGVVPRRKLRLSKEQYSRLLEESFRQIHTLNPKQIEALALQLKLRPRQVEVWFQNRRARSKLKQTEMECEYPKRWFGSLTEQNRRLQIEVDELKAMKVAPPAVILPHASTLTTWTRCERVTTTAHGGDTTKSAASTTATKVGKSSALQ
ncbi:hypothetical protein V6N13_012768 [Hibiscus sabdariffa]|uniref:Homeobox domain-containing protein n=1 Tax=Hibiscus sabdariffa TaxID=183260 RepID=A0ABR2SG43_9ROSI